MLMHCSQDVIRYLRQIVPPVLACFGDQDARVRYYACESMYNIAKTSKGETLPYFNEIFDALSKVWSWSITPDEGRRLISIYLARS